jgi:hypothetical protein
MMFSSMNVCMSKRRSKRRNMKKNAPPPQPTPPATSRPVHGGELKKKKTGCKIWHYLFRKYEAEWVVGGRRKRKRESKNEKRNTYVISHLEVVPKPEVRPGLPRSGFDDV